jgi:limonene-1,2-epoxide hydrolase
MVDNTSENSPESVVRAFYDAWDTIGFDAAYKKFLHQDVVVWNPGLGEWHGLASVIENLARYLAAFKRPYASVDLKHIAVNGNVVLTERVETNRNEAGDDTYTGPLMSRFVIQGDKILEWAEYYDPSPYRFGAAVPVGQLAWTDDGSPE